MLNRITPGFSNQSETYRPIRPFAAVLALVLMGFLFLATQAFTGTAQAQQTLGTPSNLSASSPTETSVWLDWDDVTDATGYKYRSRVSGTTTWGTPTAVTDSEASVTGLSGGTQYDFSVRATNADNESGWAETVTGLTVPATPSNLTVTARTHNSVSVDWDDVTGATRYNVNHSRVTTTKSTTGQDRVPKFFETSSAATVRGLSSSTTYEIRVSSYNDSGVSTAATVQVTTRLPVPTNLTVSSPTSTGVSLDWDDVTGATGYEYRHRENGTQTWGTPIAVAVSEASVTGLSGGTQYDFSVRATNADTESLWTSSVQETTLPEAPASLIVSAKTHDSITFDWDDMTGAAGYAYQYREDGETNWSTEQNITTSTVTLTGLDAQTTYEFRVRAYDSSDRYSGYSELDATTRLPLPAGLSVSSPTETSVWLDWDDVTGATGYEYRYRESTDTDWDDAVVGAVTDSEASVTGLSGGTQYDFSVRAISADTESMWTTEVEALTVPSMPANLTVTARTHNSVSVDWDDVTGAARYNVSHSQVTTTKSTTGQGRVPKFFESSSAATVRGLSSSTTYVISVSALNGSGIGTAATVQVTTRLPVPTGLSVSDPNYDGVSLDWDDVTGATGYEYRYRVSGTTTWGTPTAVTASEASVTGLSDSTEYDFSVRATNASTNSLWTSSVQETTLVVGRVSLGQNVSVAEGGTANITVTASVAPQSSLTVNYAIGTDEDDATVNGDSDDYTGSATGSIEIAAGATQGTIPVVISDDSDIDDGTRETLVVTISLPEGSSHQLGADTSATVTIKEGVCDRTTEVRTVILGSLTSISDCAEVTDSDLSGITGKLVLSGKSITALKARDFRGLTGVQRLRLSNNSLASLPEDVFDDLGSLQELRLTNNSLASLPEDVFEDLTNLQELRLPDNSLASLPEDVFDGLSNLRELRLQSNPGSPFTFTADVEQTDVGQVKVAVSDAVPFDMTVTLSVTGGALSASSVAVPAGSDESPAVTVTPSGDSAVAVSATAASFPTSGTTIDGVTYTHNGIQTAVAEANQAPEAKAGSDRTVTTGAEVTLDASESNDSDTGDTLSYSWTQTAGTTVTLSNATASGPTFTAPSTATTLTFRVTVLDGRGGTDRDTVNIAVVALPAAPSNLSVTAGDGQITLGWDDPNDTGITGYEYRLKEGTNDWGNWTAISDSGATTVEYVKTGLTNGTAYIAEVRAVNAGGKGASAQAGPVTPVAPPAAPSNLSATAGDGQITLGWDDPSDAGITGYEYRLKEGTNDWGNWTAISGSGATTVEYEKMGLTNGTAYIAEVRAVNAGGKGASAQAGPVTPVAPPTAPSNLSATAGDGQIKLGWDDPNDAGITGYEYRLKEGTNDWGNWAAISGSGATTVEYEKMGLTNGTSYTAEVRAVNAGGKGASAQASPVTPMGVPTNIRETADSTSSITWSWNAVTGATSYEYQVRQSGTTSWGSSQSTTGTSGSSSSLSSDTTYEIQVRSVKGTAVSAWSSPVTGTTDAVVIPTLSVPANVHVDTRTATTITFDWNTHSVSGTGYRYRYRKAGTSSYTYGTSSSSRVQITGLESGTSYEFSVRAEKTGYTSSSYSSAITAVTIPSTPTGLSIQSRTSTSVTLNWNSVTGATQYRLDLGGTEYVVSGTSKSITDLSSGSTHSAKVRAENSGGNSGYSSSLTVVLPPATPTGVSASLSGTTITVGWGASSGATLYRIKIGSITKTATGTSVAATGLTRGSTYSIQVRAENSGGNSSYGTTTSITIPPAVPTNIRETADSTSSITWSWNAVTGATSYQYQVRRSGTTNWGSSQSTTSTSGSSSSLSSNTTYEIQVRSVKGTAVSAWSSPVTGTTDAVTLSVPANVHVDVRTATTITFDWNTHSVSGTGYRYRYRKAGTTSYTYGTSSSSRVQITGLESGTSYEFSVRAEKAGYNSSSYSSAVAAVTIPSTPTGLSIKSRTSTSVTLTWDASTGATQYRLDLGGTEYVVSGTSKSIAGLSSGSTHSAKVRAENSGGNSGYSSSLTVVLPPATPTDIGASLSGTTISVSWSASNGATLYRIQVGSVEKTATGTSVDVTGLTKGSTYSIQVRAENSGGNSNYSSSLSKVLPPATPTGLTATHSGNSITADWDESFGATTYTIYIGWGTPVRTTSFTRSDLTYGTKYAVRVLASNSGGSSPLSSSVNVTIPLDVPTNLRTTGQTAHTLTFAWDAPDDAQSYRVEWTPVNGLNRDDAGATGTSYTITHLDPGSTYQLRVLAQRGIGASQIVSSYTSYASGTTTIPLPSTPTVNGIGVNGSHIPAGKGQLSWSNPNPDYAGIGASYRIEYEVETRQVDRANNEYIGEWEAIDSGTTNNSYSVFVDVNPAGWLERARVRAHNATGNSAWSDWYDPLAD